MAQVLAGFRRRHSRDPATYLVVRPDTPLEPEFITPQDGADKQDCENRAAHRWLAAYGCQYAHLKPIYLGDDLFSHQPLCEAVQAAGGNFVFVCKPATHTLIQEYITGAVLESHTERVKHGRARSPTGIAG